MVARFHAAGFEVVLDVVYNHTGEGSELGPTLSFRGIDNASYYRLAENRRFYINDTGTGNTINMDHPMVLRMVMDSLRYWVEVMHVDGFRFDLASTLGRRASGFDRNSPFFTAVKQDPVLNGVKLVAEPWDTGPGGYQMGNFPHPFSEWNDKYRNQIRRVWTGVPNHMRKLAIRMAGSAMRFDHGGRPATASVNFLTAHDGFTLLDLVSYKDKHNEANGEGNRDGHSDNDGNNCGVEGPTDDPDIIALRAQRRRNMMATLMLSQGTPLILGGDELSNTQHGNNNAYCQDNETGWIDWDNVDPDFLKFCQKVIHFRRAHPILGQSRFLHSRAREYDGAPDLFWWRADGKPMDEGDWANPELSNLGVELRMAAGTAAYAPHEAAIFLAFNVGKDCFMQLPEAPPGREWIRHIDTSQPNAPPRAYSGRKRIYGNSVAVFVLVNDKSHY
jgi:glycogen operon protein